MQHSQKVVEFKQKVQSMPSERGFVNLWRDIDKQPWYSDCECVALFVHLMVKASHKPHTVDFKGMTINLMKGQLYATRNSLVNDLGLSDSKVFRALKKFESLGQISVKTVKQNNRPVGKIISLLGWEKWQKIEQPTEQPTEQPKVAYLKGLDGGCEQPTEQPTEQLNNNVLNNNNKSMLVSGEKSERVCHLEIREKAFEHFWQTWSKCKKLVGKINTAPKSTTKTKFLSMLNEKHVEKIGVDGFRKELGLMCELAIGAHTDIAENKDSSFRAYQNMYPAKFLTNKQWRDCAEYRGLSK